MSTLRATVLFTSRHFDTTGSELENQACVGEDVARWLMRELKKRGISTDSEPSAEDFGWYFCFTVEGVQHAFVITYRPGKVHDQGEWIGTVERQRGLFLSLLGFRDRGVSSAALELVHGILSGSKKVVSVSWHVTAQVLRGRDGSGSSTPNG